MTMTENAKLVECLRLLGWTGEQIADFILAVEGRITKEELKDRFEKHNKIQE